MVNGVSEHGQLELISSKMQRSALIVRHPVFSLDHGRAGHQISTAMMTCDVISEIRDHIAARRARMRPPD
jgi:hypothetical protein